MDTDLNQPCLNPFPCLVNKYYCTNWPISANHVINLILVKMSKLCSNEEPFLLGEMITKWRKYTVIFYRDSTLKKFNYLQMKSHAFFQRELNAN